jgi:GDPmannose 4,6-dehydratase
MTEEGWGVSKRALVTGITGQDGAYLAELLLRKGYEVFGGFRRTSELQLSRLQYLGIEGKVKYISLDLLEMTNVIKVLERVHPDEVYNLGAQSFVAISFEMPIHTAEVTAIGPLRLLEAIRTVDPAIRFYQASSSEMFGGTREVPQNERTSFYPRSPYAASKLFAHWMTVNYREAYGLHASSGILFNHESPLRGSEFVTRKTSKAVAQISLGLQDELLVGNLEARRDWGYAPEYVEAMWFMVQQDTPDDYVVATGEAHSIREFVECAFRCIGVEIEWTGEGVDERGVDIRNDRVLVRVSPELFRPSEVDHLLGDYSKAQAKFGWQPKTRFDDLVRIMVSADIEMLRVGRLAQHELDARKA